MTKDNSILEPIEQLSCEHERLSALIHLSAFMMGKINNENLPDNEKIRQEYPFWLESLLDTIYAEADRQNNCFDDIIENIVSK